MHLIPAAITLVGILAFIGWMTWLLLLPSRQATPALTDAALEQVLEMHYRQVLSDPHKRATVAEMLRRAEAA